ncbi:hypothetical protein [Flammeovirga sp. SJP92]|uniref:hypothetical protein n=1 Tax=Flammeovirga sp. SJP92 TaxID=1775430 RepID=UPI000788E669|nr:hypothetical protein [Flammeovirga sp. SJP92]KXX70881.1 hypothetical protein AVL50_10945 [Flammeovirga sp. SJP92]
MKKYLIILGVAFGVYRTNCQDIEFRFKQNTDSLDLWEFRFEKDTLDNERIGLLTLIRKKDIYSSDSSKRITPLVKFEIYPVEIADSIAKFESDRIMELSCCYPRCGATLKTTKNFIFWSNPWSITAALDCNGIDYTRKNAELILEKVASQNFDFIDELINELTIDEIKN